MKAKLTAALVAPLLALGLSACSGGGTSQEQMSQGLTKALTSELEKANLAGLDESIVNDYSTCIVEKSWDKISDETRSVIAKGATESLEDAAIAEKDAKVLEDNVKACQEVIVNAIIDHANGGGTAEKSADNAEKPAENADDANKAEEGKTEQK